jgi:hypothetical protein
MVDYALLEIAIKPYYEEESYQIEPRLWLPGQDEELRPPGDAPILAHFDLDALGRQAAYDDRYGRLLTDSLFESADLRTLFGKARIVDAQGAPVPLRLRLYIGPGAPELHELRWETLYDPENPEALLALDENILLSRYVSSWSWRPVRQHARADLKALVVIANPDNLEQWSLDPVDVPRELRRASQALSTISVDALCRCDAPANDGLEVSIVGQPTLPGLIDRLRARYDILYLVAHGKLQNRIPHIYLEKPDGAVQVVKPDGPDGLVTQLAQLPQSIQLPRLVILASCQSASKGGPWASKDGGALSALGPRLAEAGVPAVVAMQGDVTMETVKHFTPRFLEELQKEAGPWGSGQIDYAMALARRALRAAQRMDWWVPALFLRLQSGRLWYTPRLAVDRDELDQTWTDLVEKIREGECTPVLGPGLAENLLGSRREIAQRWAEEYRYPMSPHRRDNLPQMAQFVATERGEDEAPWKELRRYIRREILKGPGQALSDDQKDLPLDKLVSAVIEQLPDGARPMPDRVLAKLPFPYYISANFNNLLADALSAVGRPPQVMICPWNQYVADLYADASFEPNPLGDEKCSLVFERKTQGSVRRPLVYHLFGRLCAPNSLVLTEDHYFDFLIGATRNKELIPYRLVRRLTDSSLLFLGFRLDDWEFRVLFRTLESLGGRVLKEGHRHIAVQLDPDDGRIQDARHARRFLERYFGEANISLYWGSANDFLNELSERWEGRDDS